MIRNFSCAPKLGILNNRRSHHHYYKNLRSNKMSMLSHGAISLMVRGGGGAPTVQIINLKPVGPQGDRYRVRTLVCLSWFLSFFVK
jgi:hypothetical protein